jgi:hypothetical protein
LLVNKTNNYLSSHAIEPKKITTYDIRNYVLALGQAQKYGGVEPVNGMPTILLYKLDLQ